MKALVLSMISIAATVAAMTACTSESDQIDEIQKQKDEKVEIKATAGIGEIITKTAGVVNQGDEMNDIAFVRVDSKETIDWTTATLEKLPASSMATDGKITFGNTQYFNSDANIKTNLIGYHPNTGGTRDKNVVKYTIDGQQDIMCTAPVQGDKTTNKTTNMQFAFEHLLTQFSFQIKAEDKAAVEAWGEVTSIELINQNVSAVVTLNNQTITFDDVEANTTITIGNAQTAFNSEPTTAVSFGNPIMVQANQSNYTVKVKTTKYTDGINIQLSTAAVASTSYVITLTFKGTVISGTGSIGEWKTGDAVSGDVQ